MQRCFLLLFRAPVAGGDKPEQPCAATVGLDERSKDPPHPRRNPNKSLQLVHKTGRQPPPDTPD